MDCVFTDSSFNIPEILLHTRNRPSAPVVLKSLNDPGQFNGIFEHVRYFKLGVIKNIDEMIRC